MSHYGIPKWMLSGQSREEQANDRSHDDGDGGMEWKLVLGWALGLAVIVYIAKVVGA